MKENAIEAVLSALTNDISAENAELYKGLSKGKISVNTPEEFYFEYIYPHSQYLNGLVQTEFSKDNDVIFIMLHSDFIEHHFEKLFEKMEGSACCADKSRTIMKGLLLFYQNGQRLDFNYNQQFTYHLPDKIFKTHDSIIQFYEGLKHLYYGHPEKYLSAFLKVKQTL